jgi:hypothetical protein
MEVSKMEYVYLYARRTGKTGTRLLKLTRKEAITFMRQNWNIGYQIGVLGSDNINAVRRIYGEYAPFTVVNSREELERSLKS